MSRAEAAAFAESLEGHEPFFDHEVERPRGRLRVRGYTANVAVPEKMISAARAVVFKASRVVVVQEADGLRHVMPGGRREPGESVEATARRELLEECGWHVHKLRRFAFLHFQHPEESVQASEDDFVNILHVAEATQYEPQARDPTQGLVRYQMMRVRAAFNAIAIRHRAILTMALLARGTV